MPRLTNLVTVEVWGFMKRFPTASTKSRKIEDVGVEFLAKIGSKISPAQQTFFINVLPLIFKVRCLKYYCKNLNP